DLVISANVIDALSVQRQSYTVATVTQLGAGDTITGSTILNNVTIANLVLGMVVSGPGIPAGATILGISGASITLSRAATATATGFSPPATGPPATGNYQLTFTIGTSPVTTVTTAPIAFNATADTIRAALQAAVPAGVVVYVSQQVNGSLPNVTNNVTFENL